MKKRKKKTLNRYKNNNYLIALGKHCRKLRVKSGFSVNKMVNEGERLSPDVINRLESGSGAVTVLSIARYAEILELHPRKLLDFPYDFNE